MHMRSVWKSRVVKLFKCIYWIAKNTLLPHITSNVHLLYWVFLLFRGEFVTIEVLYKFCWIIERQKDSLKCFYGDENIGFWLYDMNKLC